LIASNSNPSPLELYESQVTEITDVCADAWFAEQLTRCRAGDRAASRRISESCLARVLAIAKKHWRPDCSAPLLDAVQEGNAALAKAIKQFSGNTADEFLREMTAAVERRVILFLQHPDENWPV
jgi:DNA-directed RNA polymerase sigma subunit (sigma70/sigma32)